MKKKSYMRMLTENLSYAYISQIVSTLVSICFTLLVPKILGVEGYGYWQLIVFYATYLGVFYLGINDGIYLKNGGKTLEEIDTTSISSISKLFFIIHSIIAFLLIVAISFFVEDVNRSFVLIMTAIFLPLMNIRGLYGHLFQAINKTKVYSISLMIDRLVILIAVLIGLVAQINDFRYYVSLYVIGAAVATAYCCYMAKDIIKLKRKPVKATLFDAFSALKAGLPLMLSSITAIMITGVTRQIIDMRWDIKDFSKISLSLTMMNFVLVFLNQSSLVLFPAIRKIQNNAQIELYSYANKCLNIVLPFLFIFYVPVGTLVELWLPDYTESVKFLGILLPICIFDGKMNLINNTYYKVLRLEKRLFAINIATFLLNLTISLISAYIFENINYMAYGLLISIVFRSVIAELLLNKHMKNPMDLTLLVPIFSSIVYIVFNVVLSKWESFIGYVLVCVILALIMKKTLTKNFKGIRNVLKQANESVNDI